MSEDFNADDPLTFRRSSQVPANNDVPGMGDEPVMCPFCNKPLPPALFAGHDHAPPRRPMTPRSSITEGRSQSLVSSRASISEVRIKPIEEEKEKEKSPPVAAEKKLLEALPVASPVVANSETFAKNVTSAESADSVATKTIITTEELKRWSKLAGISVGPPEPVNAEPEKPIPLIPPPTESQRSTSSSSRFGFFGRGSKATKEDGEEESDDEGGGSGYAKLTAPGSPSDEETLHDEPKEMDSKSEKRVEAVEPAEGEQEVQAEAMQTEVKEEDLRAVLKEVLIKVNEMVG